MKASDRSVVVWGVGTHGEGVLEKNMTSQPRKTATTETKTTVVEESGKAPGCVWKEVVTKRRKSTAEPPPSPVRCIAEAATTT